MRPILAIASTGREWTPTQCDLPDQPGSMERTCCRVGTSRPGLDERRVRVEGAMSGAQLVG